MFDRKESVLAWNPFKKKDDADSPQTASVGSGGKDGGDKKSGSGSSGAGAEGPLDFDSVKAGKFFERAQTLHEATNFGYAMNMWIRGMRFDPIAMNALEGFFKSAGSFFTENPKGEKEDAYKETVKAAAGKTGVDKYLSCLVQWSAHPLESAYAVRAMDLAAELGLGQPAVWIAEGVVGAVNRDKRPRKEHLVSAMHVFKKFDKFELAVQTGEAAMRIDPLDGVLASEVKNLSAEWTTKRGGFDQQGEGGFRSNIRDAAKQRQMEESDRVVTTGEVVDRQVGAARADYEANANDRPNAIKLIDVLMKRAKPEDEEEAIRIAEKWHGQTQEYRFREYVDKIRVAQLRRAAYSLKLQQDRPEATDETKEAYLAAKKELLRAEILSLQGQVAAYPTDLTRKFQLGKLMFQIGKFEEAIGLLQEAKGDAGNRSKVNYFLGLAFQRIGWNDEAIETLRQAMTMLQAGDQETEMTLQYALLEALLARGTEQGAQADAEEAYKLCSAIATQNINYKDIRAKRDQIKSLIAKLRGGGGSPGGPQG
jgi:tetratricopeptide (TPR) repeat protein